MEEENGLQVRGIGDIQQLAAWLISRGIDTAVWGTGSNKSLQDFWNEIAGGEAHLEENPPQRVIGIVSVIVRAGPRFLIELEQELNNGRLRLRGLPLSEKMRPGESPLEAAMRGIDEELRVGPGDVKVLSAALHPESYSRESNSFPGLLTKYMIYKVEVEIKNLPGQDFWTDEVHAKDPACTRRHHWRWVDRVDGDC